MSHRTYKINGQVYEDLISITSAGSEGSDEPVPMHSLTRAIASRIHKEMKILQVRVNVKGFLASTLYIHDISSVYITFPAQKHLPKDLNKRVIERAHYIWFSCKPNIYVS